jgi:hypothetical protein
MLAYGFGILFSTCILKEQLFFNECESKSSSKALWILFITSMIA